MPRTRYLMVHMDHHTLDSLAGVVREALGATDLSDREIERRTGISRTTLDRRLADGDFRLSQLSRIAHLLEVPAWKLLKRASEAAA